MKLTDVMDNVRSTGVVPILVEALQEDDSDLRPTGTLEDYIVALKALNVSVVLVEAIKLTEEYFYCDDLAGAEDDADPIDLRATDEKLRSYEAHVGEVGFVQLWAPSSHGNLVHDIQDAWWVTFHELVDATRESIESRILEETSQSDMEEEVEWRTLRDQLLGLTEDPSFQKLKTQRAMREYALDQYPDLQEWDQAALKEVFQALAAKMEVRKSRGR